MRWQDRISIKADVCHGRACIKGRRVMVSVILASLAEGDSPETIIANYHLTLEDIQAAMLFAAGWRMTASAPRAGGRHRQFK